MIKLELTSAFARTASVPGTGINFDILENTAFTSQFASTEYIGDFETNAAGEKVSGTVTSIINRLFNGEQLIELTGISWDLETLEAKGIKKFLKGEDIFIDASMVDYGRKDFVLDVDIGPFFNLDADITIQGSPGSDLIFTERLSANSMVEIKGGDGDDFIRSAATDAKLIGGAGNDRIWEESGGTDTDFLIGGRGNDELLAVDVGKDVLSGGSGDDTLDAGPGRDKLNGGADNDILTGGSGRDKFIFARAFGDDEIADFKAGADRIVLKKVAAISDFDDLEEFHLSQVGADVVIDTLEGNTIVLTGVDIDTLGMGDFIF